MAGHKTFTASTLTASDVNGYLMAQANIIVNTVSDITTPVAGMIAYETSTKLAKRCISTGPTVWEIWGGGGAWTSYTPSFTGITSSISAGNASISGAYRYSAGRTVDFWALFVWGTTTFSVGGWTAMSVSLPVDMATHWEYQVSNSIRCTLFDATGLTYPGVALWNSASSILIGFQPSAGTNLYRNVATATDPVTWATNDYWSISGTYESVS